MKKTILSISIITLVIIGCKDNKDTPKEEVKNTGINLALMDSTISPKEDFFSYVNGTWFKNNEIPDDRTRWGSFDELRKNTDEDVLKIIEKEMNNPNLDITTDAGKAVALYKSILDTTARNEAGIDPIKTYLQKINEITNSSDLQTYLTEMESAGGAGFFGVFVGADSKDSNKNVVYL
ncbi:MAG: M13 family peptidase, partial [Flavobacteriaceae bacterium]|nr:M13 family peptidase [Flavobacteriaceae bacterium]